MSGKIVGNNIFHITDELLEIERGGLDGDDQVESLTNIEALHISELGVSGKAAALQSNSKLPDSVIPSFNNAIQPTIKGPKTTSTGSSSSYIITNYNSFGNYSLQCDKGTISRNGETITYISPNVPGKAGFKINDRNIVIDVVTSSTFSLINITNLTTQDRVDQKQPLTIISTGGVPSIADTLVGIEVAIFKANETDVAVIEKLHLTTEQGFSNVSNVYTFNENIIALLNETDYIVKIRSKYQLSGYSNYSTPKILKTKLNTIVSTPLVESPVANSTNYNTAVGSLYTGSLFNNSVGVSQFKSSDWEVSLDPLFENIYWTVKDIQDVVNSKPTATGPKLDYNTVYYIRTRYKDNEGNYSQWSPGNKITSANQPTITTPVLDNKDITSISSTPNPTGIDLSTSLFQISSPDGGSHYKSEWTYSTDVTFNTKTETGWINPTASRRFDVYRNQPLYVMVRYQSSNGIISNWSNVAMLRNIYP